MAAYSISARVGEPKTRYIEGTKAPTSGQAIELRVNESLLADKAQFWDIVRQLMQRMHEQGQPRF